VYGGGGGVLKSWSGVVFEGVVWGWCMGVYGSGVRCEWRGSEKKKRNSEQQSNRVTCVRVPEE
jgi:hypothetical protein